MNAAKPANTRETKGFRDLLSVKLRSARRQESMDIESSLC